jgi:uroporphyrinogen III methyltransferase / synthase
MLTLRAAEVLANCDVVLYDALANSTILEHTRIGTECVSVGKHGRGAVWTQLEIHDKLLEYARQGKSIVRLKGGDTSIFARTGEEIEFLLAHHIPFEVVPGVTAASAASACAGIPLTHRDWSSGVAFITGHQQAIDGADEADDELDWASIAKFPGTLVIYMGVTNVELWSQRLIEGGRWANTPVAIVRHASLPNQSILRSTLGEVGSLVGGPPKLRPPVVFIIGEVARLEDVMNWFSKRTLVGESIVLTRPAGQNESLRDELAALGANVIVSPALLIKPVDVKCEVGSALFESVQLPIKFNWIVFSSSHGVQHWIDAYLKVNHDIRHLHSSRIGGVGPSVREALAKYHLQCDLCLDDSSNAEKLADALKPFVINQRVLVVTTNRARTTLVDALQDSASEINEVIAYTSETIEVMEASKMTGLSSLRRVCALATSVAIAEAAFEQLKNITADIHWLCLSERIATRVKELGASHIHHIASLNANAIAAAIKEIS